ncbi:F-box-like domain-containing protein [Ceratobasidium sp. AG-Ba]|nr:F-box-like domain-containing protein [Ceratobasidium sp. AG-Ba]
MRAGLAGLYIHITERNGELYRADEDFPRYEYSELNQFLRPLMPRVCGLEITSRCGLAQYIRELVSSWIQYGTMKSAKYLVIEHKHAVNSTVIGPPTEASHPNYSLGEIEKFQSFFESLRTLRLHEIFISPANTIYHGLTELHLYDCLSDYNITQSCLFRLLSASLAIRSLRLIGANILAEPNFSFAPLSLKHLETLSIRVNQGQVGNPVYALALIKRGSDSFSMGFEFRRMHLEEPLVSIVQQFLAHSNVKLLHVRGWNIGFPFRMLLTPIPQLHTLALSYCDLRDSAIENFDRSSTNGSSSLSDPWPQLQVLLVHECVGIKSHLQRLLAIHPVQKFRAWWKFGDHPGRFEDLGDRARFEQVLRATIPDVKCGYSAFEDPIDWDAFPPPFDCDHDPE